MTTVVPLHLTSSQRTSLKKGKKIQVSRNESRPGSKLTNVHIHKRHAKSLLRALEKGKGKRISAKIDDEDCGCSGGGLLSDVHRGISKAKETFHQISGQGFKHGQEAPKIEKNWKPSLTGPQLATGTDQISGEFLERTSGVHPTYSRNIPSYQYKGPVGKGFIPGGTGFRANRSNVY
jgi:hypothetical protein